MDNSSAPPSDNALPQGEKRKRGSEPPPPPQNVNKAAATRARIVEILASTANGCLSELGYFPGMPTRMKELEQQNATWKEENVKLFQDNRHLLAMVKHKNKQLELSGMSDPEKVQKIIDLENEVHQLKGEVERLRSNAQYAKLLDDYRKLTESYRLAYNEVGRLSAELQAATAQNQQRPPPQHPPHPLQRSQSISHMQRTAMIVPQSQPAVLPQGGQPLISPVAVVPPPPPIQNTPQQGQRFDPSHPQIFQNRQHAGSNHGSRRSSLNISNPPIQVPSQGPNSPAQPIPPHNLQPPQFGPSPQATFVPFPPPNQQTVRRASTSAAVSNPTIVNPFPVLPPQNPIARDPNAPSGNPYPVLQAVQPVPVRRHSQPVNGSGSRIESAPFSIRTPIPNQPPDSQVPPPPLSASGILAQSSLRGPPSQPPSVPSPTRPEQASQPPVQTISPQETYINPPSQPEIIPKIAPPPPSFVTSQAPNAPVHMQDVERKKVTSLTSTLPDNAPVVVDTVAAPLAQSPLRQTSFPSPNEQHTSVQEAWETPRVADLGLRQNVLTATSFTEPARETSAPEDQDRMQVDGVEGGDGSEEEVELGPDGLRLVRDCLEQIFGDSRAGQVVCRLCEARFAQKVVDQPPAPFIDPTDEQLEAHCIEEHQLVWDELRRPD